MTKYLVEECGEFRHGEEGEMCIRDRYYPKADYLEEVKAITSYMKN